MRRVDVGAVRALSLDPVDAKTLAQAQSILDDVLTRGTAGFLEQAERLGDLKQGDKYMYNREDLKQAFDSLPVGDQQVLQRTADRIKKFAAVQRASVVETECQVPGGKAGQILAPVERAGCYAPGGRYPLPSSVLMTACTARVAGVKHVIVASPRPQPVTLAAAFIADADSLIAAGGAQAIGAFAFGLGDMPSCDVIVGPGNRWVTAAKKLVSGRVNIDMLAGPSECLVIADGTANPNVIAADLLAQAEHDTDAIPILITMDPLLPDQVNAAIVEQLKTLSTAAVASVAVSKGFYVLCDSLEQAISTCNVIGPEHLEVMTADSEAVAKQLNNYGGLFIGSRSAEVFGDYGAGPNHVLPTSGTSRYTGGLSVFTFLRIRTWLRLDDENSEEQRTLLQDAAIIARMEGLEGHARAAEQRLEMFK